MKKYFWLLPFFTIFLFSCESESTDTDLISHNLNGKVKVFKELMEGKKKTVLKKKTVFNAEGNYEHIVHYGINQTIKNQVRFTLDDDGRKIARRVFNAKDSLVQTWKIEYDEQGNKTKIEGFNNKNALIMTNIMTYNDNNYLEEHKVISKEGKVKNHIRYKYDAQGNEIEKQVLGKKGNVFKRFSNSYEKNLKVKEEIYNFRDSLISVSEFEYDQFGNVLKKTTKARKTAVHKKEYEYDEHNNWTKCTNYVNDKKKKTFIREYEYFE